jgi:hypothetical protein
MLIFLSRYKIVYKVEIPLPLVVIVFPLSDNLVRLQLFVLGTMVKRHPEKKEDVKVAKSAIEILDSDIMHWPRMI